VNKSEFDEAFPAPDTVREGKGIGPALVTIRRADDNVGVEAQVDWEALDVFCEDKHQVFFAVNCLRGLALTIGKRAWGKFGRKWKRSNNPNDE